MYVNQWQPSRYIPSITIFWKPFYLWACEKYSVGLVFIADRHFVALLSVIADWILANIILNLTDNNLCLSVSDNHIYVCIPHYHILKIFIFMSQWKSVINCFSLFISLYIIRVLFDIVVCHNWLNLAKSMLNLIDHSLYVSVNDNQLGINPTLSHFENLSICEPKKSSWLLNCFYNIPLVFDIVFHHERLNLANIMLDFTDNNLYMSVNDNHLNIYFTLS